MPKELRGRKSASVILAAVKPHALIFAVVLFERSVSPAWYVALPIYFLALLLAHRLFQTMVHDSAHHFFSNSKKKNDLICDFAIAGRIGSSADAYRRVHLNHHRYNGSGHDPEFVDYEAVRDQGGISLFVLRYILCGHVLRLLRKYYFRNDDLESGSRNGADSRLKDASVDA